MEATNKPKYNIVSELQNYMFPKLIKETKPYAKNIFIDQSNTQVQAQPQLQISNSVPVESPIPVRTNNKYTFFSPSGDSLFWCFYVMKNGISAYEQEPASFVKEKTEKFRYIELMRSNKAIFKAHRIRKLCDIEASLSIDKQIDVPTFMALCALEQLNAVIFKNQLYSDIIGNTSTNAIYVLHQTGNRYKLEYEQNDIKKLNYDVSHFKLPLKSISGYKLSDLHDICTRLKIIIPVECKKKQNIYDLILERVNKID
jgi:hypothetical protein